MCLNGRFANLKQWPERRRTNTKDLNGRVQNTILNQKPVGSIQQEKIGMAEGQGIPVLPLLCKWTKDDMHGTQCTSIFKSGEVAKLPLTSFSKREWGP